MGRLCPNWNKKKKKTAPAKMAEADCEWIWVIKDAVAQLLVQSGKM